MQRAFGNRRHAAERGAHAGHGVAAALHAHIKRRAHRRNVVVHALADFVHVQCGGRRVRFGRLSTSTQGHGARQQNAADEFTVRQRGLLVGGEETLDREAADAVAQLQFHFRAQSEQRRRQVGDRRGVGEVAADSGLVADLHGAEAAQECGQGRVFCAERSGAVSQRHGRADVQVAGGGAQAVEFFDAADADERVERPQFLGDFQRQVGAAGDQPRAGQVAQQASQFPRRLRQVEVARARLAAAQAFELARLRFFGAAELVRGRGAGGLGRGVDNRAVAGAAAEVAGEVVFDDVARGGGNFARFPVRARFRMPIFIQRKQRHHEPRRAESALRGVVFDQRALHRVECAVLRQVFDAD